MTRGRFITFEGGEGTGKSTQARRLADALRADGREVVLTREPGGSPGAEAVRDLVVNGDKDRWSPVAETLLMYAARADHLDRIIRPALARGAWVVCDRFSDSTRAYQGLAGGAAPELIEAIDAAVVGPDRPDLTLIFDLPPETGLERAAARGGEARFEAKGADYHRKLANAFRTLAGRGEGRVLIDASGAPDEVAARVDAALRQALPLEAGA
ncbi:dTMP kinase [Brevundimonas lutea]|uniref:dTMP kinase n=1 Tax=Brevundimonas lutea TaxID=2293980 RepID=UPI000F031072|nr:dTMP kinase [Brevundimonas lutea]